MKKPIDKRWHEISLDDVFLIYPGKRLTNAEKIDGITPFIGATDNTNGVTGFVGNANDSMDSNVLGVNYNGAPCIAFYHPYKALFSDDVKRLHPKAGNRTRNEMLFLKEVIMKQRVKYSYGYKFNEKRMLRQKLMLPLDEKRNINYSYMSDFVKEKKEAMLSRYLEYLKKRLNELGDYANILSLNEKEWGKFRVGEFFKISRPAPRNKDDYSPGDTPFVASGSANNGVMKFVVSQKDEQLDSQGCITVSPVDGSTFFQPIDFLGRGGAGSSILILRRESMNIHIGEFFCRSIEQTCSKYNYGHMGNKDSIARERIMLPIDNFGQPDFKYMEQYSKNMMIRKYQKYLEYLESEQKIV